MGYRSDVIHVSITDDGTGSWVAQVSHQQDNGFTLDRRHDWRHDDYDFRGEGPMNDQVLAEIATLSTELLAYSVERMCGLQLALF